MWPGDAFDCLNFNGRMDVFSDRRVDWNRLMDLAEVDCRIPHAARHVGVYAAMTVGRDPAPPGITSARRPD